MNTTNLRCCISVKMLVSLISSALASAPGLFRARGPDRLEGKSNTIDSYVRTEKPFLQHDFQRVVKCHENKPNLF